VLPVTHPATDGRVAPLKEPSSATHDIHINVDDYPHVPPGSLYSSIDSRDSRDSQIRRVIPWQGLRNSTVGFSKEPSRQIPPHQGSPRYPQRIPPIETTRQSYFGNKGYYYHSGIKRDMIRNTEDGKYFIYGKHKGIQLPYDLIPGEQILKINGQDPNPTNIASLFSSSNKDETTTLTLENNDGGTTPPRRTITIKYPIEYGAV
jgi:hypothetical protein